MDVTTQRRCLGAIAATLFAAGAGAVAWSLSAIEVERVETNSVGPATAQFDSLPPKTVSQSDAALASRPLRRPLYDPPPQPPAPKPEPKPVVTETPPPQQPKLDVILVGTIIEGDQSLAIVAGANGEFDVKGVGESLELSPQGITIESIESERVTLRYQGRPSTIEIDRNQLPESGGAASRGGNRRRNNR